MGSGMGPMSMTAPTDQQSVMDGVRNPGCGEYPKSPMCFKDNRATLQVEVQVLWEISAGSSAFKK